MPVAATVCKVVDLHPIPVGREAPGDAPPLKFRIEVRKLDGSEAYDAIVYRLESFKLTTRFARDEDGAPFVADHELFVVDDFFDPVSLRSSSPDEVIRRVEAALWKQLKGPDTKD